MSTLALIVSIVSAIIATASAIIAKNSTKTANKIALENLNISHAMMEHEIRTSIENSKSKLSDLALSMSSLFAKEKLSSLDDQEKIVLDIYEKTLNAATQTMLNMYEDGCAKYLDNKIDKERFKKTYQVEIRNLVDAPDFKKYFDSHSSRYKAIIKIYTDWENAEL